MAGGQQSPRQKMINLMYLVFIAMLAMNVSKEVLSAFGLFNEKLETANIKAAENNTNAFSGLELKAEESPEKFAAQLEKAKKVKTLAADFNSYLAGLKSEMVNTLAPKDQGNYESMDKGDFLDKKFFIGENYTDAGKEFVSKIENFRKEVSALVGEKAVDVQKSLATRFETGDKDGKVTKKDKTKQDWLKYHFEGFPLVASLTKLTQLQADIKATEHDVLASMLNAQLTSEISMTNYTTLLEQPKSAYYSGEKFNGNIVLGRKDNSTKPNEVVLTLDGRKLSESEYTIEEGKVKLNVSAGRAGEHKLEGKLIFKQDGEDIEVPVSSAYSVIPKPNAAVISADKMNVVYRGVSNPMTISIPGIPSNKVNASATGLSRSGSGYVMRPGSGREVTINVSGTLPDGQRVGSKATFRIKDVPRPTGTVRGEYGNVKMPKSSLAISTIGAKLEDFDFDLKLGVKGFKFSVPGQPSVSVRGSKLDARAKSALKRAKRGDMVQIFDIQASIIGNSGYKLKKVSPIVVEITN